MILGLILAFASAMATNFAFLFKHRGAVLVAPIRVRHPLRSAAALFRSKWFAVGWIVAIVAWGLHVGLGTKREDQKRWPLASRDAEGALNTRPQGRR